MKAFLITAAAVFGLITVVHIGRVIVEGARLATEPWLVLMTLTAAALGAPGRAPAQAGAGAGVVDARGFIRPRRRYDRRVA